MAFKDIRVMAIGQGMLTGLDCLDRNRYLVPNHSSER
jgi:hypothetical protein